jgi:microcin C transport system substrate-binding protein
MPNVDRISLIALGLLALLIAPPGAAAGAEPQRRHAISRVGSIKFGPDFKNFDWVNPDAPKGGTLRLADIGGFDNLNPFTFKGLAASGLSVLHDGLMTSSLDEPATSYGLIAEWISYPPDCSSVSFGLNPAARFQDKSPITVNDVIFSYEEQEKADPVRAIIYKDVDKAEQTGANEVTFRFKKSGSCALPFIMSGLQIIPRHYWTGKNAAGETRDLTKTTLEPPVGSGPYRVKSVDPGRNIVYERVPDYWAKDLPVNRGQWNFDSLAFTSFRDEVPAFEAFKAGVFDLQQENNSKRWAIEYQFPAARDGRVARLEIPTKTVAPAQAFVFNMRRERFADPRVRHAFELAFDFETANRDLFYGQYTRLRSYFDNSELAARGLPQGAELALLEQVRDKVPPEVFTTEFKSTVNGGPEALRGHLREAVHLLEEAGWKLDGARRKSKAGVPLSMEMLVYDTSFDRILLPYQQALVKLGITLTIRVVDAPQYVERVNRFDFDMIIDSFP